MPRLGQSSSVRKSVSDALRQSRENNSTPPHLIVRARAGTGKTTTLIEGLKILKGQTSDITPSPQQALVWDSMKLSSNAQTIAFAAFNSSIAEELRRRVPAGCEAMTMHQMGGRAVRSTYRRVFTDDKGARVQDFVCEILGKDFWELRKQQPTLFGTVSQIVGLCKMNLINGEREELDQLISHYGVDLDEISTDIYSLVPRVLELCKDVQRDGRMDFNDMIWLPVVLRLPVTRYDLLLVDEAQDLNRAQQELAKMSGRRLIFVGDDRQAIYGFAGADSDSLPRLAKDLAQNHHCVVLPLTVTRRCGKVIVEEAKKIVPDFEAHESNGEGKVSYRRMDAVEPPNTVQQDASNYASHVGSGDVILCRVTAPLVQECFKFIKAGRKANIQGRDIGAGLVSTVNRVMKDWHCEDKKLMTVEQKQAQEMSDFMIRIAEWRDGELRKELAKKTPSDSRMIALCDRHDCLIAFAEESKTVSEMIFKIQDLFTNDKHGIGIRLSSIHKAKGLEWKRVFLLMPEGASIPHPMAKTKWQKDQEYNLLYVAITRAIEELVYVTGGKALPKKSATKPAPEVKSTVAKKPAKVKKPSTKKVKK